MVQTHASVKSRYTSRYISPRAFGDHLVLTVFVAAVRVIGGGDRNRTDEGFEVLIGAVSGCFWPSLSAHQAVEKSGKILFQVTGCTYPFQDVSRILADHLADH